MASGTPMVTFANDQMKMRWREPYVTEGLNKKMAGVVPRGVYRGFRLASNGAPMLLDVLADPDKNDHVAVYETDTAVTERYSLRVELTAGDFTVDLTAWPSQTVYICLYAEYSTLATTAASLRVYTVAEYNGAVEKDELVILGMVNVPALGNPIPDADVTWDSRTFPWDNVSDGAKAWQPVLANPSFEEGPAVTGPTGEAVPHWQFTPSGAGGFLAWEIEDTASSSGNKCLQLSSVTTNAALIECRTRMLLNVLPGQKIRWKFKYEIVQAASTGLLDLRLAFADDEPGGVFSTVVATQVDMTAAPGGWVEVSGVTEVPAGVYLLYQVSLYSATVQYAVAPADSFRVDELQVWVERAEFDLPSREDARATTLSATNLLLRDWSDWLDPATRWSLLGESGGAVFGRQDQRTADPATLPVFRAQGGFLAGDGWLDTADRASLEPRFYARSSSTYNYTLIRKIGPDGINGYATYLYASQFGRLAQSAGAGYTGSTAQWSAPFLVSDQTRFDQSTTNWEWLYHSGSGLFAEGAWKSVVALSYAGGMVFNNFFNYAVPRVTFSQDGSNITFIKNVVGDGNWYHRQYVYSSYLEYTSNASWNGAAFQQSDPAKHSFSHMLLAAGLGVAWNHKEVGAAPWLSWDKSAEVSFVGNATATQTYMLPRLNLDDDGTNWDYDDFGTYLNSLYARNIPKAWIRIQVSASPGAITVTGREGFFVASVAFVATASVVALRVTLKSAVSSGTRPSATATLDVDPSTLSVPVGRMVTVHASATNVVDIYFWEEAGGVMAPVDADDLTDALAVNLHVHGSQG